MFVSHSSVLFRVLIENMSLVLEKGTPNSLTKSYVELMMQFSPAKFDIDTSMRNILAENSLIKVRHKTIACDQPIVNVPGKKSDKLIQEIAWLPLPFRSHHTFPTNYDGFCFLFRENIFMYKAGEVWFHKELIEVLKYNHVPY